ncbi:hypothetical protein Kfla_0177 [Kribbella flavida DSM 17836]|uniref:Uncharacterized protein n=1 Tax=Kribbella flavida (strain DSM 17836 / JCM 10339 / NBRC 14399) TaxID=479435 RepID=D2PRX5_KRIFD|nr:hypothetical protein [Kribbella flavida]ADB29305.1 hypothetical protein Kfla_0177 [Kribbella flavida DSM 17836]
MSSPQFPTYGRGDDPDDEDRSEYYAKPAPYGPGNYSHPPYPAPPGPGQPQAPAGPGQPPLPGYGPGYGQPADPGHPQPADAYTQPPAYRPGHPYGAAASPQPHELPTYGPTPGPRRDPRAARVVLLATIIAAVYGLLVVSVQRVSLRDISQAPGSPLNHPLRTDVIDTIGQLLTVVVGVAALVMWLRDLRVRRQARRRPDPVELAGLGLVGLSLIPILIWAGIVLSTGLGAVDESLDRLPTAYGWGGLGLLVLALGFALGYRELKPEIPNPVVQAAPERPPWE